MKVPVVLVPLPPPTGVEVYAHVGAWGGGGALGGGIGGGAEGGWQVPSQSTMYSTCTKLPSYAFSSTAGVAVVMKVYVPSGLGGSATIWAHWKNPRPSTTAPSNGLHFPCTFSPLANVCRINSLYSS